MHSPIRLLKLSILPRLAWNVLDIGCKRLWDTGSFEAMHCYMKGTRTNNRAGNAQKQAVVMHHASQATRQRKQPVRQYNTIAAEAIRTRQIVFDRPNKKMPNREFSFTELEGGKVKAQDTAALERVLKEVVGDHTDKKVNEHLIKPDGFCQLLTSMLVTIHTRGSESPGQHVVLTDAIIKVRYLLHICRPTHLTLHRRLLAGDHPRQGRASTHKRPGKSGANHHPDVRREA